MCKKIVHVICAEPSNEEGEGYGSIVICKNCSKKSNDDPPIKKASWTIKYPPPPQSTLLKDKKPQPKSALKSKTTRILEQEKHCICLTCFRNSLEPCIYLMSPRDNSTNEHHNKMRHPGETKNEIEIVNRECSGKEMEQAREKYLALEKKESEGNGSKHYETDACYNRKQIM